EPMNPTIEADRRNIARAGPSGGPEVVIEATGAPEPINDAFRYAGHGGRVVLLGSTRGDTEQVNFYRDVHKKGLTILGAHNAIRPEVDDSPARWTARRDRLAAMRALATRRLNLDPLITHRFAALEHDKAYRLLFDWDDGFLGCVLHWPKGDVPTPEA
ncbi:MAG: zinc-binding dehydrogenase, partial [Actinobacteria bacterium]|nr:zinc-binding dehydrogenase [Actinomycetota bacterium]